MSDVLATLHPRPARRWLGIAIQGALGLLVISVGLALPNDHMLTKFAILAAGGFMAFGALQLYRATEHYIELTRTELRDSAGHVLAAVDNIAGIDRGAFAFKPSQGFLVRLNDAQPRHWAPGLWWRMGRFVGVGGVTPAGEGKFMAEMLAALIAERDAGA
ncbi:MAG: hypothetical protein AAFY80_16300 [Pseudomonadota bacterium]